MALGARKAHEWIARNQSQLLPVVIAHLGAVIKYTAGAVARAPKWVQEIGLEWLWRVKEEPPLWRRYVDDGLLVGKLVIARALPAALRSWTVRLSRHGQAISEGTVELALGGHRMPHTIRLNGIWTEQTSAPLRQAMAQATAVPGDLRLDLLAVQSMDSAIVGLLLLLRGHYLRCGHGLEFIGVSADARRSLRLYGADYLLETLSTRAATLANAAASTAACAGDPTWLAPQFPTRIERAD